MWQQRSGREFRTINPKFKIKMYRILHVLILLLALAFSGYSQTVVWDMAPADYSAINRIAPDLYKVAKGNLLGLVHADGSKAVEVVCTEITPFYDGYALLIQTEGGKDRVLGNITLTGKCHLFSDVYYALEGQWFYSEGLLSVEDDEGRKGYVDDRGHKIVGFDDGYSIIKPFSEGYATVFKNKKYALIDKNGNKEIMIIGIGEVWGGTNVYDGKALIWDTSGKFYAYNVNTKKCTPARKPKTNNVDYLYCFADITNRRFEIPYANAPSGQRGVGPIAGGGKYGYALNNKVILPPQFDKASQFEDDHAVVSLDGKFGILRYVGDSKGFSVSTDSTMQSYTSGRSVDCKFVLDVPEAWKNQPLSVTVKDGETVIPASANDGGVEYAFSYKPNDNEKTFVASVSSGNLMLLESPVSYTFKKRVMELRFSVSVDKEADGNGNVGVTAIVSNPNSEPIHTVITLTGGSAKFREVSREVTINGGSSITLTSSFTNITQDYSGQHVKVSASKGGSYTKSGIAFKKHGNIKLVL